MFYIIYKITNQINGKFYIGSHKTTDLNDNYMGSGKYLKRSIEKHGLENFKKEILHVFDNADEMYVKEAEIVTDDFLAENNTYNLKRGGCGGFDYINSNYEARKNQASKLSITNKRKGTKPPIYRGGSKPRKVSDDDLLRALMNNASIRSALRSAGLPVSGNSFYRAKKLLEARC